MALINGDGKYICAGCGGKFVATTDNEDAQKESEAIWGRRGDTSGMAVVCDACWEAILEFEKKSGG